MLRQCSWNWTPSSSRCFHSNRYDACRYTDKRFVMATYQQKCNYITLTRATVTRSTLLKSTRSKEKTYSVYLRNFGGTLRRGEGFIHQKGITNIGNQSAKIPAMRIFTSGTVGSRSGTLFSTRLTSTVAVSVAGSTSGNSGSKWWSRFAIALRYIRIPVLVISVYSLGYQQGIIDCIKEPMALQNQILNGILLSTGCTSMDDVDVIDDEHIKYHSFRRSDQVAIVGHKIISAARNIVESRLQNAMMVVKAKLPTDITPEQELQAMSADPDVQFYYNARLRINGEQIDKSIWQYVFIKSSTPNAFVTEVLPRKFFITTAMLQVATTPDELAVVLGHEISHLILGHVSSANKVETLLRTIEVLLLSMDPTAGALSVLVIGAIYAARRLVSAAYSRENEVQADALGLEIAASACYDTVAGCKVMYKMHHVAHGTSQVSAKDSKIPDVVDAETLKAPSSSSSAIVRLMDTHPPSLDRYETMLVTAQNGENYTKYINCANMSRRLFNALWGTKNQSTHDAKEGE
jgi:Zn-dependent protease with chaperone function